MVMDEVGGGGEGRLGIHLAKERCFYSNFEAYFVWPYLKSYIKALQ